MFKIEYCPSFRKNPCYNCPNKGRGKQGSCEQHLEWKAKLAKETIEIRSKLNKEYMVKDTIIKNTYRMQRRKRPSNV